MVSRPPAKIQCTSCHSDKSPRREPVIPTGHSQSLRADFHWPSLGPGPISGGLARDGSSRKHHGIRLLSPQEEGRASGQWAWWLSPHSVYEVFYTGELKAECTLQKVNGATEWSSIKGKWYRGKLTLESSGSILNLKEKCKSHNNLDLCFQVYYLF